MYIVSLVWFRHCRLFPQQKAAETVSPGFSCFYCVDFRVIKIATIFLAVELHISNMP